MSREPTVVAPSILAPKRVQGAVLTVKRIGSVACLTVFAFSVAPGQALHASGHANFISSHALLLPASALPHGYTARTSPVVYSVADWDGGIKPLMAIDERNGWLEGAQQTGHDNHRRPISLSVQLFRTAGGARADFGQFFTNAHPETMYTPGAQWLGGSSVRGYGDLASLYRIEDDTSKCSQHLSSGLSFTFSNALFSVSACTIPAGETQARNLAKRLISRARRQK